MRGTRTRASRRRALSPAELPGARAGRLPAVVLPQLATLVKQVPEGDGWLHEIKYDGYRLLCRLDRGRARIITRNGNDWTERLPTLAAAVKSMRAAAVLLDGEIVKLEPSGVSDFQLLQNAIDSKGERELVYYAFDILHLDGLDLSHAALIDRKRMLAELLEGSEDPIRYSDHHQGNGKDFLDAACRLGLEGIVSKRADRPYRPGRSGEWLKVKCGLEQEFVIGGWTEPAGSRTGFGALLLGVHAADGKLRYAGKVGTGFTQKSLAQLRSSLGKIETPESPFDDWPRGGRARGVHWVQPVLVAQVAFTGWTQEGFVRHPSFQGLRDDKPASAVVREKALTPRTAEPGRPRGRGGTVEVAGVAISNADRVLYPEAGITKGDVARYYEEIAGWILPHLEGRPLTLVRCPTGRGKGCFFQKHANDTMPAAIHRLPIEEERKKADYLMVDSIEGLLSLVQMGTLELHTWGSRVRRLEFPDRIMFDLDPDPELPWARVIETSLLIRERLADLGLESFLKTTGGKGLHIVAPLSTKNGWDEVKEVARALALSLSGENPRLYTAVAAKKARSGKIFIDYMRNGRGATAIAAYSTRAREGAPVSAPIRWDDLRKGLYPGDYTLRSLPERWRKLRKDPWEGYGRLRQSISKQARRKLGL